MARRELPDGFELDDDPQRIDVDAVHALIAGESYWGRGRDRDLVERAIRGSTRVVGLYRGCEQVGFARAVSDGAIVAYLADVYVLAPYRGRGLGLELVREIVDNGRQEKLTWLLHTADAQGGALKRLDDRHAELKTMHTVEHVRGQGIGRAMLDHLLAVARERNFRTVSLETGAQEANDAGIVGMALLEPCRADDGAGAAVPDALHISMVFVDPVSQRQGIGSRLMRYALDRAHASGISSVSLWTDCENMYARRLYEALGMKPTRTRRVSETVEWVRYELDLESASI